MRTEETSTRAAWSAPKLKRIAASLAESVGTSNGDGGQTLKS
ncbi:MAG: hypothetical protein ABIR77_04950 [Sphingomicrobium sp.]